MKKKFASCICIAILAVVGIGCVNHHQLAEGDILFQNWNCGELCQAIGKVTKGFNGANFSHCGLVVREGDSLCVIEAFSDGVKRTSLRDFFNRSGDTGPVVNNISIGRLKSRYHARFPVAIDFARSQLGVPYDDLFLPDNGKLYCSELIHLSFAQDGGEVLFPPEPMTFKDPETNDFFPVWEAYYQKLGHPIPEGILGTNPGLLSRSEKLDILRPAPLE